VQAPAGVLKFKVENISLWSNFRSWI